MVDSLHKGRCPVCKGITRYQQKDSYKRVLRSEYARECGLCGWKEGVRR